MWSTPCYSHLLQSPRAERGGMKPLRRSSHFGPLRPLRRQTTSSCTIYTSPLSTSTLPVFTPLTLTWDPSCLSLSTSTIDLYLEVINNQSTSTPVHEWTGIVYSSGKLETTFNPSWWNASTGAGEVNAQVWWFDPLVRAGERKEC